MKFADVIVPLAVDGFFTYVVPAEREEEIREGNLVIVPFAGNKKYTALVVRLHENQPSGCSYKIKVIESVIEREIRLSEIHLRFLLWISEYYMAATGDVLRAALPVFFRLESFTCITREFVEIEEEQLTEKERILFRFLQPGHYTALKDIEKYTGIKNCMGMVRSLLARGYVRVQETVDEVFREKTEKIIRWTRPWSEEELNGILDGLKRAPAQYTLLCRWIEQQENERKKADFLSETGASPAILKALCDKGILEIVERQVSRLETDGAVSGACCELSDTQKRAFRSIQIEFENKDCVLLQGVTSSGKTEVYIHLIQETVRQGKQVLYMLPEIALTVQIIRRLQRVFGNNIGIYHSGMPDAMRAELWKNSVATPLSTFFWEFARQSSCLFGIWDWLSLMKNTMPPTNRKSHLPAIRPGIRPLCSPNSSVPKLSWGRRPLLLKVTKTPAAVNMGLLP